MTLIQLSKRVFYIAANLATISSLLICVLILSCDVAFIIATPIINGIDAMIGIEQPSESLWQVICSQNYLPPLEGLDLFMGVVEDKVVSDMLHIRGISNVSLAISGEIFFVTKGCFHLLLAALCWASIGLYGFGFIWLVDRFDHSP
ncbi:hypothetical protein [Crocosphaera chwakensis]|uniref:Uncharacterized protein n=1 Tax=Crocosphaera chwakensis CCY0110 TaxID=391612 RepID=A3IS52_9CHRO|nr:hypothetical protein [Crocosphaera chwakensis]EAZ90730.1 hypothetical protein CY0110_32320 [Crocosphaera chwakensis CCY0110]